MKYNIDLPASDYGIANNPELGGESEVLLSYEEPKILGTITQPAPASGILDREVPAMDFGSGVDLVARARTGLRSSASIVVTLNVTFVGGGSGTATATFAPPAHVQDQSFNIPMGLAVDVKPGVGNESKKIASVTSVASVVGGVRGNKIEILALPESWFKLGCARTKNPTYPVPQPVNIPCGLNASAFTKMGMSEPGSLELSGLQFSYADGLTRLNGHRGAVMIEVKKENVLCERQVFLGYVGAANSARGDGSDEVLTTSNGMFENFCVFV